MMIDKEEAKKRAQNGALLLGISGEREFEDWSSVIAGEPVLVHNLMGEPSYWVVPLLKDNTLVGFARIGKDGEIEAIGSLSGATTVTGIDAEEALKLLKSQVELEEGEELSPPLYVHDGPPGKEAWLFVTRKHGRPWRWIFVTPAFVYERRAGQVPRVEENIE